MIDGKIEYKDGEPEEWFALLKEKGRNLTKVGIAEFTREQWGKLDFPFGVENVLKKWASPQGKNKTIILTKY